MRLYLVLAGVLGLSSVQAGTVYMNGKIVTLDGEERIVDAMKVEDGKIVAVGSKDMVLTLGGDEFVDLKGKMVVPGFIETHCHSIGASRAELAGGYEELYSVADIQRWVREKAKTVAKGGMDRGAAE